MDDFNQIYGDYQKAFMLGHDDGSKQAHQKDKQALKQQALMLSNQLGKQLALYQTFLNCLKKAQMQDQTKQIKKIHSPIVIQKSKEVEDKIQQIVQILNSKQDLSSLNYSVQFLHFDREELKSKFQTLLSILGIKQYEKKVFQKNNKNSKKQQENEEDSEDDINF